MNKQSPTPSTTAMQSPRRARLHEASEYGRVSVKTLRRRIADGSLPGYRLGTRVIMVDLNDIDALFDRIPTMASAS